MEVLLQDPKLAHDQDAQKALHEILFLEGLNVINGPKCNNILS